MLPTEYQNYIAISRYARWIEKENRRETWSETVERYVSYMERRYEKLTNKKLDKKERDRWVDAITTLKVMPSMRALMTAGAALDKDNVAGFNCSYVAIDNVRTFDEIMYILMCGTGVGFSVERQYVDKLPDIAEQFHKTAVRIGQEYGSALAKIGKKTQMAIPNAKILGDVGVDKVNMIPYGIRTDKEKRETCTDPPTSKMDLIL